MQSTYTTKSGGRIAEGDTVWLNYHVEAFESFADAKIVDAAGRVVGCATAEICTPPQRIPTDFDPETEQQGCCDPPLDQSRP